MNRRTKVLFGLVILAGGGFVIDKIVTSLWWEPWKTTQKEIADVDTALVRVNRTLRDERKVQDEWTKVKRLLDKPRTPDVQNHFVEHLGAICDKVKVPFDFQGSQTQRQGDFKEYVVDSKLKLGWNQYLELLNELSRSTELLKPIRININSAYEKEDRLDVDLRISTIEFDPVPQKTGAK